MAVYSLGTSNHSWAVFAGLLSARGVQTLVDVRSRPRSRFAQFNRRRMEPGLAELGITYVWLGEPLGGEATIAAEDPAVHAAIAEMAKRSREGPLVYICTEGDPAQCHRAWTVAPLLHQLEGMETTHILRDGSEEDMAATETRFVSR